MLEPVRFTTHDPAKLAAELDRFVLAVKRELASAQAQAAERYRPRQPTYGAPGSTVKVAPKLGELVPLVPALGSVDVLLPSTGTPDDASRSILLVRKNTSNTVTLLPGTKPINGSLTAVTLPAVLGAYIVVWDGVAWWTVNDA